jgi:hypothetical protein
MDKKVHQANVKMSQEMKVFLRLLIINSLKKHTIFITATLLKYHDCREITWFLLIITLHYLEAKSESLLSKSHASLLHLLSRLRAWCVVSFNCLYCKIKHNIKK